MTFFVCIIHLLSDEKTADKATQTVEDYHAHLHKTQHLKWGMQQRFSMIQSLEESKGARPADSAHPWYDIARATWGAHRLYPESMKEHDDYWIVNMGIEAKNVWEREHAVDYIHVMEEIE